MLDAACGRAVHSKLNAKQAYTTLELKVSYHRSLTEPMDALGLAGLA